MLTATTGRFEGRIDFDIGQFFFYCFLFMSLFLLIDPFYFGYGAFRVTRDLGVLKYFGLIFGFAALFFTLLGQAINVPRAKQPPWRESLAVAGPRFVFAAIVLTGSLIARFHLGIKETFLQLGIGFVGLPLAVIMFWGISDHLLVAKRFMLGLLLVMPVVIGWVVFNRLEGGQAFHTEIFLFVPLGIYFFLVLQRRWLAYCILVASIGLGIASHKNTAYLIVLLVIVHLLLIIGHRTQPKGMSIKRALVIYGLIVSTLAGSAVVSFLLVNREEYLPTGNVEARTITYSAAIDRFLTSPLYGQAFLDTGLVQLEGKVILGKTTVISHSDLLDILSHGGLITSSIFIWGLVRIARRARQALNAGMPKAEFALVNGLISLVICGLVTAAFNSPLISLPIAVLFWFALGLLVSVSTFSLFGNFRPTFGKAVGQ
jgi:hypothetical protein